MQAKDNIITINIGKNGLTDSAVNHVKELLKQHGQVRLKFLKSAKFDAGVLGPNVVKTIGRTLILKKE